MNLQERFRNHPKVKQAKQLLIEADREVRRELKDECDNEMCRCGHTRSHHTSSHSINYTGGPCTYKKCNCPKEYSRVPENRRAFTPTVPMTWECIICGERFDEFPGECLCCGSVMIREREKN